MQIKPISLDRCLREAGIQPSAFAYFLTEYVKKKKASKKTLSILLTDHLKAQADVIVRALKAA